MAVRMRLAIQAWFPPGGNRPAPRRRVLSVLECWPQAPANCRTCRAFTRATDISLIRERKALSAVRRCLKTRKTFCFFRERRFRAGKPNRFSPRHCRDHHNDKRGRIIIPDDPATQCIRAGEMQAFVGISFAVRYPGLRLSSGVADQNAGTENKPAAHDHL